MAIFTAAIGWATSALVGMGLSATVAGGLVRIGASLALNAISSKLFGPKMPNRPRQEVQATINQAAAYRVRAYGLVKLGGVRALYETNGGWLHQIVVSHHGRVNRLVHFVVDGKRIGNTLGEVAQKPWGPSDDPFDILFDRSKSHLVLQFRDGSGQGGNYPHIKDIFPNVWTDDHRLEGMTTFYAKMKAPKPEEISKIFPKGANTEISIIVESSLLFDPRGELTEYSENSALALRDYLTHRDGWNIPAWQIDDATVSAFADRCDELVPLRFGGEEPRYRTCGYYSLDDACKNTTERMLEACDGQVYMTPEGKVGLMGGGWSEPDVTLDESDIISIDLEDGRDPFADFNVMKGVYIDAENEFQETEVAEWRDMAALATQPERVEELTVDMCPSGSQLQRLRKVKIMRARREWTGTIRTKLSGSKARFPRGDGAHIIRVVWAELDIDQPFEVLSWGLDPDTMQCVIEIGSVWNAWAWDASTEEQPAPARVIDLVIPEQDVPAPEGLVAQQNIVTLSGSGDDGQQAVRLVASVTDPDRPDLRPLFFLRRTDIANQPWEPMGVSPDSYTAFSPVVSDNATFAIRARFAGSGGGLWEGPVTIDTLANPVAPAEPTNLSASVDGTDVTVRWRATTNKSRVFRAPTSDFTGASSVGTIGSTPGQYAQIVDEGTTGTWYYWVVALNASLVASEAAGPVEAII